ncbi:FAD-dependent oxidoreductase [Dactylosporangium sp. NPDC051485]|uniref:protoporphyrinogen/coproporphyrinogen oxidase n=1 Tax=Dactylosporangium sp. NPDC051485 TaxID=3154846 RepID=UPI0034377FDF
MSARFGPAAEGGVVTYPSRRAKSDGRVVILGGGPCGLACADELQRLGHHEWTLLEAAPAVGGLGSSVVDRAGFTWDLGGHVVFSKLRSFDALFAGLFSPEELLHHDRSSFVRHHQNWVPYPFQQHLHHLPRAAAEVCLADLIAAQSLGVAPAETDFATWLEATYGRSLVAEFFAPYNRKVWSTDLHDMSASWIADRVAPSDTDALRRALDGGSVVVRPWGPNSRFAFPATGGTGAIWRRLASRLNGDVRTGTAVDRVDVSTRTVLLSDGTVLAYEHLVATGALDKLVAMTPAAPEDVQRAAAALRHTTVAMIGLGYRAPTTDRRSWLYFPGPDAPFYRATNLAAYAPANVPDADPDRYSSWMTEVSLPNGDLPDWAALIEACDAALRRCELVPEEAERVSGHVELIPYAYPVPTVGRDVALAVIQPWLEQRAVYSRGRFGTWRYEIGNMDHAVTMGQDIARRLVHGVAERLNPVAIPEVTGAHRAR